MMSPKGLVSLRTFFGLVAVGFVIHFGLGLNAILQSERRFRMKPRYLQEVDVRGRTYHVHREQPVDLKLREEYERRRQMNEALRPHLMARREILAQKTATTAPLAEDKHYVAISGGGDAVAMQCNRCAIVGSAGTLLGAGAGEEIDSADCVFRMGLSPTRDFEQDVGSKTTARIIDGISFSPFLKKPLKLVTGPWSARNWFLFNVHGLDAVARLHGRLRAISRKHGDVRFFRFNRDGEQRSMKTLKDAGIALGYKLLGVEPGSLWYTVQVVDDSSCSSVHFYGVPDPKLCKRSEDLHTQSRYWDQYSTPLCLKGSDAGLVKPPARPHPDIASVADRRALLAWARQRNVSFSVPPWPQFKES